MKTIRRGTFETNSSSCHSITFNNSGENVQGDTKVLYAEARNIYCGSDNYQYDREDNYEYDAGAPIGNPQGKFEYALICFVEQLNTIAEDMISTLRKKPSTNLVVWMFVGTHPLRQKYITNL
jgi:hypothetical protein